ncbi:MAG TPA: hypothetical protein VIJ68_01535 [Candidatus Saccharimonadales bacterium]
MKAQDTNDSLELLVEQTKSIYHTRFNNLTHQSTKAGIIVAANGAVLAILGGLVKPAGINLSESLQDTCIILIFVSVLLCAIAIFYRSEVPILDIKAARKNIDIMKNKKQFMEALIDTYSNHIDEINKSYEFKDTLNLVAIVLTVIAFGVIIGNIPSKQGVLKKVNNGKVKISVQQQAQF